MAESARENNVKAAEPASLREDYLNQVQRDYLSQPRSPTPVRHP